MPRLESPDVARALKREADFVEPVQQAMLVERVDLELEALAARRIDRLLFQIDGEPWRS